MIDQERAFKFRYFHFTSVSGETRDMIAKFQRSQLSLIRSVLYLVRSKD